MLMQEAKTTYFEEKINAKFEANQDSLYYLASSGQQVSESMNAKAILIGKLLRNSKRCVEILIERLQPVVTDRNFLNAGNCSKVTKTRAINIYRHFQSIRFLMSVTKRIFFQTTFLGNKRC